MDLKDVIKRPIITEKSTQMSALGKYNFAVDSRANKKEIARAVEEFFEVRVQGVRTTMVRGKTKRIGRFRHQFKQPNWKKAIIQLAEGEKIDLFDLPAGETGTGE